MKNISFLLLMLISAFSVQSQQESREYYQLKIYSFETEGQEKLTDDYLKNAFLPALKRLDINKVGVFKLRATDSETSKKTYVLIPFTSIVQFSLLDDTLAVDKIHQQAGKAYLNAPHNQPAYQRVQSVIMKAFVDMPRMEPSKLDGPRKDRIYELRSYESASEILYRNKVDMFNAGGEVKLFDQLKFNAVFYAEVLSGANMPNLMYMTTHANQETRDANWKAFGAAPEWQKLKVDPNYQNNVSSNDKKFLYPTEYSDY
ncbi:MAG: NIPSNAP family protein [Flavobacteriaceae bacterium]